MSTVLFEKGHQAFYQWLFEFSLENDCECLVGGSSSLAQAVMNKTGEAIRFNDVDVFCDLPVFEKRDVYNVLDIFGMETEYCASVKKCLIIRNPTDHREAEYFLPGVRRVAIVDLRIHPGVYPTRLDETIIPVQLIVIANGWRRDPESNRVFRLRRHVRSLWRRVLSNFDISVSTTNNVCDGRGLAVNGRYHIVPFRF